MWIFVYNLTGFLAVLFLLMIIVALIILISYGLIVVFSALTGRHALLDRINDVIDEYC